MQGVGGSHRNTYRLHGGNDLTVWLRLCGVLLTLIYIPANKYLTPVLSYCVSFLHLAVSHNRHFRLWEEGAAASAGVQNFAELGVTVEIMKAAKEARKMRSVGAMYRMAGIPNGIGHSSTELLMQPRNSLVGSNEQYSFTNRTHMLRHSKSHKPSIQASGDLGHKFAHLL